MSEKKSSKDKLIHNRHFVPAGDFLLRQGEKGDTAYLVQSGSVRVFTEDGGKTLELGKLGAGDIVGEMALVIDAPRSASVQALENTNFIKITRPMMIERMAKSDPLIKAIMPMLMKRIAAANQKALNRNEGFDEMVEAVTRLYESVHKNLPAQKKRSLENAVLPKMDEFIKAIENFQKLYAD